MSLDRLIQSNAELQYPSVKPELDLNLTRKTLKGIDPAYSFTRNSSATYVGPDGLIKTAGVNQPRVEYDPVTGEYKGLLVEESRANYHRYSTNFANWTSNIGASTLTATTATLDPAGGTGAYVLYGQMHRNAEPGPGSGASFPFRGSVFVKRHPTGAKSFTFILTAVGGDSSMVINFNTETVSGNGQNLTIQKFPNGWYRIGLTIIPGSTFWRPVIGSSPTSNAYWYVYGVQMESSLDDSSYIPTTSSTVTRQPDQLVLNKTLNAQGTLYVESRRTTGVSISADNGTESLTLAPPVNQNTKTVLYYNTNRTLLMSSGNNTPVETNTNPPQDLNRISLGFNRRTNDSYMNGHIKKFSYYSSPLTEDNLRALTGNKETINRSN